MSAVVKIFHVTYVIMKPSRAAVQYSSSCYKVESKYIRGHVSQSYCRVANDVNLFASQR